MKKIVVIMGLLFCGFQGNAQIFTGESLLNNENFDSKRWSWGYFLGFNSYRFDFDYSEYDPTSTGRDLIVEKNLGFNVGLIGNLKLNKNLDLRLEPGVSFNNLGLRPAFDSIPDEINSTYVHIPLLLKFSANRLNNFKPFIVGGVSTSINLSSNENNPEAIIRTTTNNFYYELGFGVDLYFYYFKFSPSLRGVFAIDNELVEGPLYMRYVENMSTRAIFINFTFQ